MPAHLNLLNFVNLLNPLNLVHAQSKDETPFPYFSTDDTIPVFCRETH